MPWNFGEREGLVGSILSYLAGEVPGETGSPEQVNKSEYCIIKPIHYPLWTLAVNESIMNSLKYQVGYWTKQNYDS